MGVFSICATLKSRRDKSEGLERAMYLLFFFFLNWIVINYENIRSIFPFYVMCKFHNQSTSRTSESTIKWKTKNVQHRKKCYDDPNKYLGMIIDGMDQKKTLLPHFVHTPKNLQEHLVSLGWLYCFQWKNVSKSLLHSSKYP